MPKTRQQRLAEERAGHPPSPPQHLEDMPRAPIRTRAKTPNVPEVAGPVVPATQSAMPEVSDTQSAMPGVPDMQSAIPRVPDTQSAVTEVPDTQSTMPGVPDTQFAMPGEPRTLLRIWVDVDPENSGRPVGDAILQETIPSSRVPELVAFLKNICNQEKDKVPKSSSTLLLDQLTPSQEMVEAIPSENPTVNEPPKARKRAFRRNPLHATSSIFESQPVTTSLDASAAGGIFSPQAAPPENAPETAFDTAPETAPVTAPITAPETPRRSKWSIENLFQPGSIKKFLGFNPLATVPESPDSVLQMSTTTTTQTLTAVNPLATVPGSSESLLQTQTPTTTATQTFAAEPAPASPKSTRRSSPSSARDARAKKRRHNESAIKPVKSATTSKSQRDRRSWARKASPACGETETTTVEEEQLFDVIPRDRAQREARQVGAVDSTPAPIIRWPSRSLDRINQQNKRKRVDEAVAGPASGGHGLGEADLSGSNEEYGATKEHPSKIRRTSGSSEFTSQVAVQKTLIPITSLTGTFKVPSPGDDNWIDSGSEEEEEEEGNTAGLEDVTTSRNNNEESALDSSGFLELKVPSSRQVSPPTQSEAVRKAREKLQKFKPRNPSRLIQSSRAYPSPPSIGEAAAQRGPAPGPQASVEVEPTAAADPEPIGRISTTSFNAYEEWRQTAPPAVTAALDKMEVDNNMAGAMFERGLGDPETETSERANRYNAFEEWSRTASPTVLAVLDKMEVDDEIAGQVFESGLDKSTEN